MQRTAGRHGRSSVDGVVVSHPRSRDDTGRGQTWKTIVLPSAAVAWCDLTERRRRLEDWTSGDHNLPAALGQPVGRRGSHPLTDSVKLLLILIVWGIMLYCSRDYYDRSTRY